MRFSRNQRAPPRTSIPEVERQTHGIRIVSGGQQFRLTGDPVAQRVLHLVLLLQIAPRIVDVQKHRFERVRMIAHAAHEISCEVYARMLLPNAFVSSRNHLNHAARARRTYGIPESIPLIERIERQNIGVDFAAIFIEKASMVRMFDKDQVLGDVDDIARNTHPLISQALGCGLEHRRHI